MFWPPASTPPIVASGEACSLIIAMLAVTVARSCLLFGSSKAGRDEQQNSCRDKAEESAQPSAKRVPLDSI
jgi:hypothetical protein